jgi:hypothetical protein
MTARQLQVIISFLAVILAIVHLIWPHVALDGVTITLLLIAILPWLAPLFKSVELPGGVKVEFQELEKAKERADKAGLLSAPLPTPTPEYSFQLVADEDPNLALAGLRIEIEKRLVQLAESRGIDGEKRSVGKLLQMLSGKDLITLEERSVLADLVGLLNSAVHGATVDSRAALWAMQVGPRLLKSLDERIQV